MFINLYIGYHILQFTGGIITSVAPPVLAVVTKSIVQLENSAFSFNIQQSEGYPTVPTYQWFYNEEAINTTTSTNPNVSVYPEITFNPVVRTQSGNYSMTASTEGGDSTGYFILDVLGKSQSNLHLQ